MSDQKPKAFQHVDGGLREQLQANVVNAEAPLLERMVSAMTLIGARGLLDQVNRDNAAVVPGSMPAAAPLPATLPAPKKEGEQS